MKLFDLDWKDYINQMEYKDVCIIDPPWNYNQQCLNKSQLNYELLFSNGDFLDYMFKNLKSKHILLWTTNSMLIDVFQCNHYDYIYKTMVTWVKTTKKNLLAFGMGYSFRNCTEQLLVFSNKNEKAMKTKLRNIIVAKSGNRTIKPKKEEVKILKELIQCDLNKFSYIFSGPDLIEFNEFDIECVDKNLKECLFFENNFVY